MAWKKGQSGNPAGRPKGAKDKLSQQVYEEILKDWAEHGLEVIQQVRAKKPELYLQAVIRLVPTSHEIAVDDSRRSITEYSPEEMAALLSDKAEAA